MTTRDPGDSDLRWQAAAEEVAPHKSLQRIGANARAAVGTIAVVATLLAGLGTFAASQLTTEPSLMFAAAASVGLATLAAALSLSIFVNRGKKITPSNLTAVKKWYAKELSKGKRAALGGVLLIAAIVTAGGTAVAGLLMSAEKQDMRAQIGVTSSQKGGTPNVHVSVRVLDMSKESAMVVNLKGHSGQSWLNATIQPAADGIAVLEQDIETAISKAPLTLSVKAMDGSRVLKTFRTVNINGTARPSTDPTEDCRVAKPECPDSFHSWRICKKD